MRKIYMRCDGYYTNTVRLKFWQKRVIKSNYFNNHIALNIKKLLKTFFQYMVNLVYN